jgi:hypothetical protein
MEKIYASEKLTKAWEKEARHRKDNLWWFDLDDVYGPDVKLDGESPILFNEGPIKEEECWNTFNRSTCMLLLRNGVKTVVAVVHEKAGGVRLYSQNKTSFIPNESIIEDAPGVFLLIVDWKTYATQGLIVLAKKYLRGTFKPEAVFIDPAVNTLTDWNIVWVVESALAGLGKERIQSILGREV